MEEKGDNEQSYQHEETIDETNQDGKVTLVDDTKQSLEEIKEKEHENIVVGLTIKVPIIGENHIDSPKKPKPGLKQNRRTKSTIPQPFTLETEKRISRERRRSMDFNESKPKLTKLVSVNYKVNAANTTTTNTRSSIPRPKITTTARVDKRFENGPNTKDKVLKEVETKKAQGNIKKQEREEVKIDKFQKSSTFKASPLPSFYHRKESPKAEIIKKTPATRIPKSPLLGQQGKSNPNMEQKETEAKNKVVTRTITRTAKETISKLLRTTQKSSITPKETLKGVKSTA